MARYRNPESEPNIRRIDSRPKAKRHTHGFQVHFDRQDETFTKLFSDSVCGRQEVARAEARKFKTRLESKLPPRELFVHATDKRSKLGKVGFSFRQRKNKDGSITRYISASARIKKGKAMNTQIRIENDDIESALKKAVKWRKKILRIRMENEKKVARR